jgi:hypothetical protein
MDGTQGKYVYVVDKDKDGKDIAAVRPFVLGDWVTFDNQNLWVVDSGLKAGDQVIRRRRREAAARGADQGGGAARHRRSRRAPPNPPRPGAESVGTHALALLHRPADLRGRHLHVPRARGCLPRCACCPSRNTPRSRRRSSR